MSARDRARFWSGAGFLVSAAAVVLYALFGVATLAAPAPAPPAPPAPTRERALEVLGAALTSRLPPAARYAALAAAARGLLADERLKDEALIRELSEAARFAELLASPADYVITPEWVEAPAGLLPEEALLASARVEAIDEGALLSGINPPPARAAPPEEPASLPGAPEGPASASSPATAPASAAGGAPAASSPRRLLFSEGAVRIRWRAGEPLRLRFGARGALSRAELPLGGEDLERAPDPPLPDAAILLFGEPRAFSRGEGRYLARAARDEDDPPPLVAPPLLAAALKATADSGQ